MAAALLRPFTLIIYFIIYIINLFPLVILLKMSSTTSLSSSIRLINLRFIPAIMLLLLFFSMGGLPPLLGFLPKLLVIKYMLSAYSFIILMFLVAGSLINIYYYFSFSIVYLIEKRTSIPLTVYSPTTKFLTILILPIITLTPFLSLI